MRTALLICALSIIACEQRSPAPRLALEAPPPASASSPAPTKAPPQADASVHPYVLDGTEVQPLHSALLGRDYELFVSLPADYSKSNDRYPVLFVTDSNFNFPVIRAMARRLSHAKRISDFVLVGLSYAVGDTPEQSRDRDYTPSPPSARAVRTGEANPSMKYGESSPYIRFIEEEVFPFVSSRYRIDMARATFAGHSYGGLLGSDILLTKPGMFDRYILSSPSLWYGDRVIFRRLEAFIHDHKELKAKVFLAIGAYEAAREKPRDAGESEESDMVADVHLFEQTLRARHYPHLEIRATVIPEADHTTVAPISMTRGLLWAFAPVR